MEKYSQEQRSAAIKYNFPMEAEEPFDFLEEISLREMDLMRRLGHAVAVLKDDELRYPGRAGEQIHGLLTAYQMVMKDATKVNESIIRLGIAERKQKIAEAQATMMMAALRLIFEDVGLTAEQKRKAAISVPQRLRELEAGQVASNAP